MTQSELQRVNGLLRLCDTNVSHCQVVVARSFALVERARTLIKICQKTVKDREAAALRNVEASRQAGRASEQLLIASENRISRLL